MKNKVLSYGNPWFGAVAHSHPQQDAQGCSKGVMATFGKQLVGINVFMEQIHKDDLFLSGSISEDGKGEGIPKFLIHNQSTQVYRTGKEKKPFSHGFFFPKSQQTKEWSQVMRSTKIRVGITPGFDGNINPLWRQALVRLCWPSTDSRAQSSPALTP